MRQRGFAPIFIVVAILVLITVYAISRDTFINNNKVITATPYASAQIIEKSKFNLEGSEVIENTNGKESVLFKNVTNVSEVRLGPDKRTLHFKAQNFSTNDRQPLCADLGSKVEPAGNDYPSPPPFAPPWDYQRIGWAYTIRGCNDAGSAGGYLKNSNYFVYLKLTDATHGTLYFENLKTGDVKNIPVKSDLLAGFNDNSNYFTNEKSNMVNSYWVDPVIDGDGYEYFYPQLDANIQDKKVIMAFGTLILAVDMEKNNLIGGFVQQDVVSTSFWFLGQKELPFIVVESAWEGPGMFNEIIDISGGSLKTVKLSAMDKRPFLSFDIEPLVWEKDGVVFNFADFEEAADKLPSSYDPTKIGNSSDAVIEATNRQAEEYLKNTYNYLEVKCSLGFGMYYGCVGLKNINHYRYTPAGGLVQISP